MDPEQKSRLIGNIVGHMKNVSRKGIQLRAICNFFRADTEYGKRIADGLGLDLEAEMRQLRG
jgi:catalase